MSSQLAPPSLERNNPPGSGKERLLRGPTRRPVMQQNTVPSGCTFTRKTWSFLCSGSPLLTAFQLLPSSSDLYTPRPYTAA